jgi:hypothetical protein
MPSDGTIGTSDVARRLPGDAGGTSEGTGTLEKCSAGKAYGGVPGDLSITGGVGFCRGIVTTGK